MPNNNEEIISEEKPSEINEQPPKQSELEASEEVKDEKVIYTLNGGKQSNNKNKAIYSL